MNLSKKSTYYRLNSDFLTEFSLFNPIQGGLSANLFRAGGGGFRPPLSSRPVGPEGPQKWFPPNFVMYMSTTKKESGRLPKNWAREPQLKIAPKWRIWPKGWFSRKFTSPQKICHSSVIFGPIHLIFLQMIGKDSTYMIHDHFWVNLLILG